MEGGTNLLVTHILPSIKLDGAFANFMVPFLVVSMDFR